MGRIVALLTGLATVASSMAVAGTANADGVRLGPIQTACVDVAEASPGDVALTNVTAVESADPGFLTAHNEDINPWTVSSVNFMGGAVVPNLTATVVTDERRICITSSRTSAHLVVDLVAVLDGEHFDAVPFGGARILDTRAGGKIPQLGSACVAPGVPDGGGVAVVNATVTEPSGVGFATVHRSSDTDPLATSTHNFSGGQTVASLTFTALAAGEDLCATASVWSDAHVIFDLVGWLDTEVFRSDGAVRLLDTRRSSSPTRGAAVEPASTVCRAVPGAQDGSMVIANVAVTQPEAPGFATVHAGDAGAISTHNFLANQTVANLTATPVAENGEVCVTASRWSSIHAVVDVAGVVDPSAVVPLPNGTRRLLDSREEDILLGRHGDPRLRSQSCTELRDRFVATALEQLGPEPDVGDEPAEEPASEAAIPATNGNDSIGAPEFSTTNTQDAAVDEGDLVETDGRYLYTSTVAPDAGDTRLTVIDIAAGREVESKVLPGPYPEMILHDDRLIVTTRGDHGDEGFASRTTVTIYDVSDPTDVVRIDEYGVDGVRVAMRSVGDRVRLVFSAYPDRAFSPYWFDVESYRAARERIETSVIEDWLPQVYDVAERAAGNRYSNGRPTLDCADVRLPHVGDGFNLTWVVEDDLDRDASPGPEASSGVVSASFEATVMASRDRMYVAESTWLPWSNDAFLDGAEATAIHQFDLSDDGPIEYAASTEVPGRLLNQFSLGEHDGVLRVAVTDGWWGEASSAVFALRRTGETFERLGAVTDLAAGESIFAVRHLGAMSYVVTFEQVDPLFVIDFNDPVRPVLRGELKIPGFSTYLHPAGPDLLLGVGQDTDEFGVATGAQLSLFDVSDPSDPKRVSTLDIGGWRTLNDHREFLFWQPTGLIAVPVVDDFGRQFISVSRLVDGDLVPVGSFGGRSFECGPDRTVLVGSELLGVSRSTITIVDRDTLDLRVEIGECRSIPVDVLPALPPGPVPVPVVISSP